MSASRSVADAGDAPPAPETDDVTTEEIDTGYGDIGYLIGWPHSDDAWIVADDTSSFVSLSDHR